MQQAELGIEGSRRSESTLGGYMTSPGEAPFGLGEVGHAPASPLASVQQHLRQFSAQSLSGFSDPGTPHFAAGDVPDYMGNASIGRGPGAFLQANHGSAPHPDSAGGGIQGGRVGEQQGSGERQGSGPSMLFYTPCTALPCS